MPLALSRGEDAGVAPQGAKERRHQVLELEPPVEDPRVLEGAARRKGLEGLDETMRAGAFQELPDGPGAALDLRLRRCALALLPEAERRHVDAQHLLPAGKREDLDLAIGIGERDDGVGGAEIDADAAPERCLRSCHDLLRLKATWVHGCGPRSGLTRAPRGRDQSKRKGPVRFPARALFVSFDCASNPIFLVVSRSADLGGPAHGQRAARFTICSEASPTLHRSARRWRIRRRICRSG